MTNYKAWDKRATAIVEDADEKDRQEQETPATADDMVTLQKTLCGSAVERAGENEERERDAVDGMGFPEPVVDGVSYTVKASHCIPEEVLVERSATVRQFVKKVRAVFVLNVSQLLYHDLVTNESLDLTSPSYSEQQIVELVPPGSTVKLVNPDVDDSSHGYRPSAAAPTVELSPGDLVKVVGLQGKPELNGKTAKVLRWVEEKHRWEVRLDSTQGSSASLALKPSNLERYSKLETGFFKSKKVAGARQGALEQGPQNETHTPAPTTAAGQGGKALKDYLRGIMTRLSADGFAPEAKDLKGTIMPSIVDSVQRMSAGAPAEVRNKLKEALVNAKVMPAYEADLDTFRGAIRKCLEVLEE